MHDQHAEHDRAISDWMSRNGFEVKMRNYDFERDVLAWRATALRPSITLRVTLPVIEDTPVNVLIAAFDSWKIAETLRRAPGSYTVVQRVGSGVGVVQLDKAP